MAKKLTKEELLQLVDEACELYIKAHKLQEQAREKMKLCGVNTGLIVEDNVTGGKCVVKVLNGISKLEKITGTEAAHPVYDGEIEYGEKELKHGDIKFYQLGWPTMYSYKF